MTTTWNPADKSAAITLSVTNHRATSTAGGNSGVRGSPTSHASGKWYIEYSNILSPGGSGRYGFAALADALGGAGQAGVAPNGTLFVPLGSVAMGAVPDGKLLAFAVDLDNLKIWARYDAGSWVGSGASPDPATNTSGLSLASIVSPLYPYCWLQNNPGTCDINAGDLAFAQTKPVGFTAWDAVPPITRTSMLVIH